MKEVARVFLGIGSNLGDPMAQLHSALRQIDALSDTRLIRCSSFYRSLPMGPSDQPDYINAVAKVDTALEPHELLEHLHDIERSHGRDRGRAVRWGPRTLDLDILVFDDRTIDTASLQIPHPGIAERAFVLYPLAEIEPQLRIPGLPELTSLLRNCSDNGLIKVLPAKNID